MGKCSIFASREVKCAGKRDKTFMQNLSKTVISIVFKWFVNFFNILVRLKIFFIIISAYEEKKNSIENMGLLSPRTDQLLKVHTKNKNE